MSEKERERERRRKRLLWWWDDVRRLKPCYKMTLWISNGGLKKSQSLCFFCERRERGFQGSCLISERKKQRKRDCNSEPNFYSCWKGVCLFVFDLEKEKERRKKQGKRDCEFRTKLLFLFF
jgi:hypothetical protein